MIRNEIQQETPLGKTFKEYTSKGKFVPDDIVVEMVLKEIKKQDPAKGFILDGFPRNINQAQLFQKEMPLDLVVNFVQKEEHIITKIAVLICIH